MESGLLHLYIGDGKGKTTAAIGAAVRAAGHGWHVCFAQFMKGGMTGEVPGLETLGMNVVRSPKTFPFFWEMSEAEQAEFHEEQERIFDRVRGASAALIVLDEVLDAAEMKLIDEEDLREFIMHRGEDVELVLTGRGAPEWLKESADYITEMKKIEHPYHRGVKARPGVEF